MNFMTVSELLAATEPLAIPIFLCFVGMVVLMADLVFNRDDERRWPAYLTMAGLLGSLLLWVQSWFAYYPPAPDSMAATLLSSLRLLPAQITPDGSAAFQGMYDPYGIAGIVPPSILLVLLVALIVTFMAPRYLEERGLQRGEYYSLLLFATAGLVLMIGSAHLILLFLGIELLSIPLYIMAGFARPQLKSQESALKYFLLGAFASSFLLYGIALLYGATGTMSLKTMADSAVTVALVGQEGRTPNLMFLAGLGLLFVGLAFKTSLAPFHQWTPDVYEGAPTPVTAFMAAGTKIGGFIALFNVLVTFYPFASVWAPVLAAVALLTMVVGNIGGLLQTNIKRMIGYSSVAHAGYMLVALAALGTAGALVIPALLLYLGVYAMMNLGTFAVLLGLEEATGREILTVQDFAGLGRKHPVLGLLLGFFLLSLAGFPPTAGFFAKLFLFVAAIAGEQTWLVVIAVVLSVLSFFYYARYLVAMFMQPAPDEAETVVDGEPRGRTLPSFMISAAVAVTLLLVIGIGLFPTPALNLFERALMGQ